MIQVYPLLHVGTAIDAYNVLNTGLAHFDVVLDISNLPTVQWNRHKNTIKVKRAAMGFTTTKLNKIADAIQNVRSEAKTILVVSGEGEDARLAATYYLVTRKELSWDEASEKTGLNETSNAIMVRELVEPKEKNAPVV